MALAQAGTGTQTAVIGTEHTLLDSSTNGTHVLVVRLSNMLIGDRVELRVYPKVFTGDTFGAAGTLYKMMSLEHNQLEPVLQSIPVPARYGARFTLKQTVGTGRAFDWEVWTV